MYAPNPESELFIGDASSYTQKIQVLRPKREIKIAINLNFKKGKSRTLTFLKPLLSPFVSCKKHGLTTSETHHDI